MRMLEPEQCRQADLLLLEVLERPEEERTAYLASRTDVSDGVLWLVEELLEAADEPDDLLEPGGVPASSLWGQLSDELMDDAATQELDGDAEPLDRAGAASGSLHPGQLVGDRYNVVRFLAQGGMGEVFEAHDTKLGTLVALKLLRCDLQTEELRQRFAVERQILARITHPNIARLLDGGITHEGRPFLVMEHVDGLPFDRYCDEHLLGVDARLELFLTVCEVVQHAHRNLVVHRDIKPGNILVDADGTAKLLDFGIAKVLDPLAFPVAAAQTRTGYRLFTPEYASPEQHRGEPVTTVSDVYQLGVLLYQLLSGRLPREIASSSPESDGTHPARASAQPRKVTTAPSRAVTRADMATEPGTIAAARSSSPERLRRRLAGDLDTITLMALREEPERRYASVERLAEDIRRHLAGLPVSARPERLGYLMTKFVRRHWIGVAASTAILLLLVASAIGMTLSSRRIARERDRAEQASSLLLEMFESASPATARGEEITVVEVLERGAERVRSSLQTQPDLQAKMLSLIARVYDELGHYNQALAISQEALTLYQSSLGEEHPETIANLTQLSWVLDELGQYDAALPLAERAVTLVQHSEPGGLEHADVLQQYSSVLHMIGRLEEARSALEEAVGMLRQQPGDAAKLQLASALVNLAWLDENHGEQAAAVAKMTESMEIRRALLDANHPKLAASVSSLGEMLLDLGNLEEAEPLLREALTIRRRVLPEGHPEIAGSLTLYAKLLAQKGELDEAEQHYREALAIFVDVFGPRHLVVAKAKNSLGMFLHHGRGRIVEATELLRDAASIFAEVRGADDPWTAQVEANLANALLAQGRSEEAIALLRKVLPILEAAYPASTSVCRSLKDLGTALICLHDLKEAETTLRRAVAVGQIAAPQGVELAYAEATLGVCLMERQRPVEAEQLLLHALELLTATGREDFYLSWTQQMLVKLYESLGREEDARRYR